MFLNSQFHQDKCGSEVQNYITKWVEVLNL